MVAVGSDPSAAVGKRLPVAYLWCSLTRLQLWSELQRVSSRLSRCFSIEINLATSLFDCKVEQSLASVVGLKFVDAASLVLAIGRLIYR